MEESIGKLVDAAATGGVMGIAMLAVLALAVAVLFLAKRRAGEKEAKGESQGVIGTLIHQVTKQPKKPDCGFNGLQTAALTEIRTISTLQLKAQEATNDRLDRLIENTAETKGKIGAKTPKRRVRKVSRR